MNVTAKEPQAEAGGLLIGKPPLGEWTRATTPVRCDPIRMVIILSRLRLKQTLCILLSRIWDTKEILRRFEESGITGLSRRSEPPNGYRCRLRPDLQRADVGMVPSYWSTTRKRLNVPGTDQHRPGYYRTPPRTDSAFNPYAWRYHSICAASAVSTHLNATSTATTHLRHWWCCDRCRTQIQARPAFIQQPHHCQSTLVILCIHMGCIER